MSTKQAMLSDGHDILSPMLLSDWISPLLVAVIALLGTWWSARLLRKTGKEQAEAARTAALAQNKTAEASQRSVTVAEGAASVASRAEEALERARLHDGTIQTLYWAADHAISTQTHQALLGLEVLGALASQARDDRDYRSGRILGATYAAVTKVAIPTFLSVLTSSVDDAADGTEGGARAGNSIRVSPIEINAARLLTSHARDLSPSLKEEVARIAEAFPGDRVPVRDLYAGRHIEIARERVVERSRSLERDGQGFGI